jgi:NADH:ubiquinone oxidoreductase subunit D
MPSKKIKGHWCYLKVGDVEKNKPIHIHVEASRGEISFWIKKNGKKSEYRLELKAIDGQVNDYERNKIERIVKDDVELFVKWWKDIEKEK